MLRRDHADSCDSFCSSSCDSLSSGQIEEGNEQPTVLPLRRLERARSKRVAAIEAEAEVDWPARLRANPLLASIVGIAHVVRHKLAATGRVSSHDSSSVLDESLEERELPTDNENDASNETEDDFGFYVAITPPVVEHAPSRELARP